MRNGRNQRGNSREASPQRRRTLLKHKHAPRRARLRRARPPGSGCAHVGGPRRMRRRVAAQHGATARIGQGTARRCRQQAARSTRRCRQAGDSERSPLGLEARKPRPSAGQRSARGSARTCCSYLCAMEARQEVRVAAAAAWRRAVGASVTMRPRAARHAAAAGPIERSILHSHAVTQAKTTGAWIPWKRRLCCAEPPARRPSAPLADACDVRALAHTFRRGQDRDGHLAAGEPRTVPRRAYVGNLLYRALRVVRVHVTHCCLACCPPLTSHDG
jgi:hypothetical protein